MSTKNAGLAKKEGYKNVRVYLEGEPAWIKDGNMVHASKGFVTKGNIVLIDLRSAKKSAEKRIPRAVSIPYDTLDDRLDDIPKKAPVVIYSDSMEESMDAYSDLHDEGFKKVSMVPGNFDGWVKNGGATTSGPVVTDIVWVRKLGKGEVGKADFMKAVDGSDAGAIILDVRTPDEASAGGFKNAIAVPLDQIAKRLSEIPKDKKVYVHCTTGARADMAAQELNKNGYKAFFFVANIDCKGNECKVED
ncbi:rhodanese-related sulfurtransferase [Desulfocapsa sulfexigens DSM 10523]|uniref:Rhodanese-related sulfurtransferase n=1 Tax=Desulfocapsa sulfexigens (strain DSM 10523 / SB164P1) TaxID=1167006 RepID=M1PU81_DESSD|nr:rhodanese-like domain-containing protein [Desulfocapsa sulfexigens]AGF79886.1 rhodanese-related sulfurtransferase [Desulfocapsa sulfexigens DSM 10523]